MAFKIIDLQDLERKLARKKTWIYDKIEKGLFPAPVKFAGSDKATGWIESEVDDYIAQAIRERDEELSRRERRAEPAMADA